MYNLNKRDKYSEITEEICYLFGHASVGTQMTLAVSSYKPYKLDSIIDHRVI